MAKHFNITGERTRELLAARSDVSATSISLANVDSSHSSIVDLYIEKTGTGKFHLLKNVNIPAGAALIHDLKGFNSKANEFGLYIKLTKTTTFTLTGSIDPAASVIVTGSGTAFLTEVSVGDEIRVTGETRVVTAIASNTSLTVSAAFTNNSNDTSPDCNPVAPVDVIIS